MGANTDNLPIASRWLDRAAELRATFDSAEPFPLLVLDDFLDPDLARDLLEEFPPIDAMPRSRDYVFGNKHELSSVERSGAAGRAFHDAVMSPGFQSFLRTATGYDVFVDPMFFGGGFHQGGDGSFLDMHVDFNVHPLRREWLRTLNVLLYLNLDWQPAYGGELLVKGSVDGAVRAIEPTFNRAVIMLTADHTFHGYRRTAFPPGVTRRSIATYAYRRVDEGAVVARTTGWAPTDGGVAKRLLARHYDRLVKVKNRWFGVGTARNR